uniref:Uncharacterized protein n=1 Tax=Nelumbo nucifera TaxID=4432 RepID=A0A822YCA7_NELNU|nr:TPA_asm: hypothetical protein HUJ06_031410 [Nelumbo nucifera]
MGMPVLKHNLGSKGWRLGAEDKVLHGMENPSEHLNEISPLKPGEGITCRIPPTYDKLAASLNLSSFSDICVEYYLKGTLDLGSLAAMIVSDRRLGP